MPPRPRFEELDFRSTSLGDLSLRRRTILSLDNREVYEIILGDAFLMSSLFTVVEEALSELGLKAALKKFGDRKLDVVVGGLGLGYTAVAALEFEEVNSLLVIDYLQPVIEWHQQELVPLGKTLNQDQRCRLVHNDFFTSAVETHFDPDQPDRQFHAVLLDIDHSPDNLLHERHSNFYSVDGLKKLAQQIHDGGVFALWSDAPPEASFMKALEEVFESCESHIVEFDNPLQEKTSASTVYVAVKKEE